MRKMIHIAIIFFLFPGAAAGFDFFTPNFADEKLGDFKGLIVGIGEYEKISGLKNAANDATAMAAVLSDDYGFAELQVLLNKAATRAAICMGLKNLADTAAPDDSVLIYYSGHGNLDPDTRDKDADGWWIPSDADPGNPDTWIPHEQVRNEIKRMNARHVLLISDSCFGGTIFRYEPARSPLIDDKFYREMYNKKSRIALTSGGKEEVLDEGPGNSMFTHCLLKTLKANQKPYLCIQEAYFEFAPLVSNKLTQTPLCGVLHYTGHRGGQFVFVNKKSSERKIQPAPSAAFAEVMIQDTPNSPWRALCDGDALSSEGNYFFIFQPDQAAFLYIFQTDSTGKTDWLFPKNDYTQHSAGQNPVPAGKWIKVPEGDYDAFHLDENTGTERFWLVAARERWQELEDFFGKTGRKKSKDFPELIRENSGALVVERWLNHVKAQTGN